MDLAADRAAIADAANTVTGVKCSATYRQVTKVGDAAVRLDNMTRSVDGFGFMVTWQVLISLGQDLARAEAWIDAHADSLIAALEGELVVGRLEAIELVLDTGKVPAVLVEGSRAA